MAEPLHSNLDAITSRIRSCDRLLLLSDFDGTLVPIHEHPEECFLDPTVGAALTSLASHGRVSAGIVSGRQLQDLKNRVGIGGITYVGNHGLECEGPDYSFLESTDPYASKSLRDSIYELAASVGLIPGAWVEDKGLTASIHYRQVEPEWVPVLIDTVCRVVARDVDEKRIVLRQGKMVLEVRPAVPWNKGTAVRRLFDRRTKDKADPLLIYLGDDETDEDVFRSFPNELTICVGSRAGTAANFSLGDPAEVHAFLTWMYGIASDWNAGPETSNPDDSSAPEGSR